MTAASVEMLNGIEKPPASLSASAPSQIGNNDGKSWNSPVVPLLERNLAGQTGHSRTL